ncbi:MAG TPA: pitrilysin family protein [Armatimonadota bacterium]|jgi:zinc protease
MNFQISEMKNGLPCIFSPVPGTPRMALAAAFKGGVRREDVPGTAKLADRLLMKGTERRDAEQLARELEERAIDVRELTLSDCSLLVMVFLNREFDLALDLFQDMLLHSTYAEFPKELVKIAGEINASLDQPGEMAQDGLLRTLFDGHPYGHTGTRMLESLEGLTPEMARDWYTRGLSAGMMNLTLVGDFDPDRALSALEARFGDLPAGSEEAPFPPLVQATADRLVTRARPDAQQAQVLQGWYAPPLGAAEQPAMAVMNNILGGAGLSSRLFSELRDKQGMAYSVRSQYLPMRQVGDFVMAIGTSPENIARARQGFREQLTRLQNEPVTDEELRNAKGHMYGVYVLSHETTSQYCLDLTFNHIQGMGPDYNERLLRAMEGVTVADVQAAAQRIQGPSVTVVVAREDALPGE